MARTPAPPPDRDTERFHEDRASTTVRGADKPDIELGVSVIRDTVKEMFPIVSKDTLDHAVEQSERDEDADIRDRFQTTVRKVLGRTPS